MNIAAQKQKDTLTHGPTSLLNYAEQIQVP